MVEEQVRQIEGSGDVGGRGGGALEAGVDLGEVNATVVNECVDAERAEVALLV